MAESEIPWKAILAVVVGIALLALFFVMASRAGAAVNAPVSGIIDAINKILAGRPPWLK
jgi:hypothetical protein